MKEKYTGGCHPTVRFLFSFNFFPFCGMSVCLPFFVFGPRAVVSVAVLLFIQPIFVAAMIT